jgi:hypothetical protein
MRALLLLLALAAGSGRPLFYWGGRAAVIEAAKPAPEAPNARVVEVHAARDGGELVIRFTFDRQVKDALRLADGAPVSGRLHAVLDIDGDDDRATGLAGAGLDLRTGSERRLELGTRYLGEDADEQRSATVDVTATLHAIAKDGRRRLLWQRDESSEPSRLSSHGDAIEIRLPAEHVSIGARARLILSDGERAWDGRL